MDATRLYKTRIRDNKYPRLYAIKLIIYYFLAYYNTHNYVCKYLKIGNFLLREFKKYFSIEFNKPNLIHCDIQRDQQ